METELITKLISLIEQTGTELWRIALQQVLVEAIQGILGLVVLCAVFIAGAVAIHYCYRKAKENDKGGDWPTGAGILSLLMIIPFGVTIMVLLETVGKLLNPEYYAIQSLIKLIER